jgi:hypothetical protein
MVSSMNTLDCWRFKEKEWILLLCVACALVIGLKHVNHLGVLLWFFVENYDNGVTSSEFWCVGFTTSLGVEFLSLLFLSFVVMSHSSRLQCRLLRVALFVLCFDRAQAFFCHGISLTIIVLEALHSRVCIA